MADKFNANTLIEEMRGMIRSGMTSDQIIAEMRSRNFTDKQLSQLLAQAVSNYVIAKGKK